jgi:ankyrin repeat protein
MLAFVTALTAIFLQGTPIDDQLLEAARKGDLTTVQGLIEKGANIEAKSPYGQTPLFFAARNGHQSVVQFLLSKGAKVDVKDSFYKMSLVSAAADKGGIEVVRDLLEAGASPSEVLGAAAYRGNKEMVALALDKSKPTPQDLSSALQAAEQAKQVEVAEMLKKAGALPPPKPTATVAPEKLALLAGTYKGEPIGEFVVQLRDGKLYAVFQGQNLELGAFDETNFGLVVAPQVTIQFTVENGKTTKLMINQRGSQFTLPRVEGK